MVSQNNVQLNSDDVVVDGVLSVLDSQKSNIWVGTMTQLGNAVERLLSTQEKNQLPKSPISLRIALNRVVNRLRSRGIGVQFGRSADHFSQRVVQFVSSR